MNGTLRRLDPGEEAAIILALELNTDVLLMDDRAGVVVARHMGLNVSGTMEVLAMASRRLSISPKLLSASSARISTILESLWISC
jgi:predicted nucleic acid-binding protein